MLEPLPPLVRRQRQLRRCDLRKIVNAILYVFVTGAGGEHCSGNSHRARRFKDTSIAGGTTEPGTGSMPGWWPSPAGR